MSRGIFTEIKYKPTNNSKIEACTAITSPKPILILSRKLPQNRIILPNKNSIKNMV